MFVEESQWLDPFRIPELMSQFMSTNCQIQIRFRFGVISERIVYKGHIRSVMKHFLFAWMCAVLTLKKFEIKQKQVFVILNIYSHHYVKHVKNVKANPH